MRELHDVSSGVLLSIVTVAYQNPVELAATLRSTAETGAQLVERIVVDGSPDGSCEAVIAEAGVKIARYVHERDRGIYDAMNKGVAVAKGKAVLMLNAGDLLVSSDGLLRLLDDLEEFLPTHVIVGQAIDAFEHELVPRPLFDDISLTDIRTGRLPSHQSTLVPTWFAQENPYSLGYGSAADTLFLRQALSALPRKIWPEALSIFAYGGRSNAPTGVGSLKQRYSEYVGVRDLNWSEKLRIMVQLGSRVLSGVVLGRDAHQRLQARRAKARFGKASK